MADEPLPYILIADDSFDDQFFLQRRLKKAGVANPVLCFGGGAEVLDYLRHAALHGEAPALLLLDLKMPLINGFAVLSWAVGQPRLTEMRIVVMSGASDAADVQRARRLGAHDYCRKFPEPRDLATLVKRALAGRVPAAA